MERHIDYGLLFSCPYKESLPTCAYGNFRMLSLKERLKSYEDLERNERFLLGLAHNQCFYKRKFQMVKI